MSRVSVPYSTVVRYLPFGSGSWVNAVCGGGRSARFNQGDLCRDLTGRDVIILATRRLTLENSTSGLKRSWSYRRTIRGRGWVDGGVCRRLSLYVRSLVYVGLDAGPVLSTTGQERHPALKLLLWLKDRVRTTSNNSIINGGTVRVSLESSLCGSWKKHRVLTVERNPRRRRFAACFCLLHLWLQTRLKLEDFPAEQ